MKRVKVINVGTGRQHILSPSERDAFAREFRRTGPWVAVKRQVTPLRIAPDAKVLVTDTSGRKHEYLILGRAVLYNVATGKTRQFYMGLLFVEWVS